MTGKVSSIVKSMRAEVRTTSIERGVYVQLSEITLHFTSGLCAHTPRLSVSRVSPSQIILRAVPCNCHVRSALCVFEITQTSLPVAKG